MQSKDKTRTDAELVSAARACEPEAFAPIMQRYQDAVFAVALARLGDFHEAEDVAQQAFVEAFHRLSGLKDPARLGAWLRSITIHRSIDRIRRRRNQADIEAGPVPASNEPTPPEQLSKQELRESVLAAVARLTKTQRETTTLYYINGYSVAEVAAIQEAPVGTVKRRLHDAREKLKQEMIGMVEDVLKSEAPKDDFSEQVFQLLLQYKRPRKWGETLAEIRKIGGDGVEGFVRAMETPHWQTRRFAASMMGASRQQGETVIELYKRAAVDPSKKVRKQSLNLLHVDVADERKREEFLPLLIPLLHDPAERVRWRAAYELRRWTNDVPLAEAAMALANEKYERTRRAMARLVTMIVEGQEESAK